jgi:hypothetical protein
MAEGQLGVIRYCTAMTFSSHPPVRRRDKAFRGRLVGYFKAVDVLNFD